MDWKPIDTIPAEGSFLVSDQANWVCAVVYKSASFGMKPEGVESDSHKEITLSFEPYYWKEVD